MNRIRHKRRKLTQTPEMLKSQRVQNIFGRQKSFSFHSDAQNIQTCNTDEYYNKSDTFIYPSDDKIAYDYELVRNNLIEKHKKETLKLRQHQGKIFYEDNILHTKLQLRNYALGNNESPKKLSLMSQTSTDVRRKEIEEQKLTINSKISDTENILEKIRGKQNSAEKTYKGINDKKRFQIYQSQPISAELRTHNKKLRDSVKMKGVSLTILRNETNKILADLEDEKKQYKIRVNQTERILDHVQDQTRTLRYNVLFLNSIVVKPSLREGISGPNHS